MKRELEVLIKEKREAVLLLDISLSQNQKVKDLLLDKPVGNLELDKYSKLLRENTPLKNIWFHVVDNKGISRYRSWTKEHGDSLRGVRLDIDSMIENPRVISSISTGKFDMTFKSMFPVYDEDKFLGFVETLAKFNSIVIKLQEYSFETIVLVDKNYKQQLTNTPSEKFIDDYYMSSFSGSKKLLELVLEKGVDYYINIENYVVDSDNSQLLCVYKLPDINGERMGYFIMGIDIEKIDTSTIQDSRERIILGLIIGFFMIGGFLLYLYVVNYKNYIQKQREELERSVAQKTEELREKSEAMTHLAHHDSLTNLPNRLYFHQKLQESIETALESDHNVGVLFLDLDGFKEINDTYGHRVGDILLQKITQKLRDGVSREDIVARLGGDEFTIIANKVTQNSLEGIAKRIITEIQKPIKVEDIELFVTFSIGLSLYPNDGDNPDLLLKYADTAMYRAKENGKNGYKFYNSIMTEIAMNKVELQNSIREAIQLEQFEPYYQPKVDARTNKVIGLEALVRWNHPQKGLIMPGEFIPFAEESGAIVEIDRLVVHKALRDMKLWYLEGLITGRLSLNISGKQLESISCVEKMESVIEKLGFDTKYLELEVTESQIIKNQTKAIAILQKFKELGVRIALDDFGTGYSSLSYLKNLPVESLKIDRSFIMDIPQDKDDVAIVKTIISLAKNLELDIIAEGVETEEQVELLMREGCYIIQGYYYSKPLNAKDCRIFLRANL
ncbi:MAG: EAL domain-containing protein [Campylobacterales bacterium]|nr:EAL domain-containing protein [Campylobacterales bacterium]